MLMVGGWLRHSRAANHGKALCPGGRAQEQPRPTLCHGLVPVLIPSGWGGPGGGQIRERPQGLAVLLRLQWNLVREPLGMPSAEVLGFASRGPSHILLTAPADPEWCGVLPRASSRSLPMPLQTRARAGRPGEWAPWGWGLAPREPAWHSDGTPHFTSGDHRSCRLSEFSHQVLAPVGPP